jgi:predicted secreted Zn-dependent protease
MTRHNNSACRQTVSRAVVVLALTAAALPAHAASLTPIERTATYAISGASPIDLYTSIGESGPLIGATRAIAHTNWDLKWRRDYQPEGSACVLKSAMPFLTITTTLPRPKAKLTGGTARLWNIFIDGIAAHERVHGADIVAMADGIIAATIGLRVENDPGCKLIRAQILKRVKAANEAYKAKARAFDQVEMSKNGKVQQLILGLVNGR